MKEKSSWKYTAAIILVAIGAFAIYYPYSPGGRQSRNMRVARQHLPAVRTIIENDDRSTGVRIMGVSTSHGGCLLIGGELKSESDIEYLQALVNEKCPSVNIEWRCSVAREPAASIEQ